MIRIGVISLEKQSDRDTDPWPSSRCTTKPLSLLSIIANTIESEILGTQEELPGITHYNMDV